MMNNIFINSIVGKLGKSFQKSDATYDDSIHDAATIIAKGSSTTSTKEKGKKRVPNEITCSKSCCDGDTSSDATICSAISFKDLPHNDEACDEIMVAPPEFSTRDFHVLKDNEATSWSFHVLDKDIRAGDTLWFRLFRNDARRAVIYLEGDEVLTSLNGILGHGQATVFYVHFARCGEFVRLDKRDIRPFLKRTLHQSKHSHSGLQLVREMRNARTAQALAARALQHEDPAAIKGMLSFPDLYFQLQYGKTYQEMKEETAAEEAADKKGSPTRPRLPPTADDICEAVVAAAVASPNKNGGKRYY